MNMREDGVCLPEESVKFVDSHSLEESRVNARDAREREREGGERKKLHHTHSITLETRERERVKRMERKRVKSK